MSIRVFLRLSAFLVVAFLASGPLSAQSWRFNTADDGHYVYGRAQSGLGLDISCNAPSQGGLDALSAEAHEETQVDRGSLLVEISVDRLPVGNDVVRIDAMIWVDGTGFRLPPVNLNEMNGVWEVQLPSGDGLFDALRRASSLVLGGSGETAWTFPVDGLGVAIDQTIQTCNAAWAAAPAPSLLLAAAQADILRGCGGPYTAGTEAILSAEIDSDAVADVVVWWNEITCNTQFPRPFCGASHCSAKVFLSTRARPLDLLAQNVSLQPLSNGKVGLNLVGRFDSCGVNSLGCERLWYWNGANLVEAR